MVGVDMLPLVVAPAQNELFEYDTDCVESQIAQYAAVGLTELAGVTLLNRIDTKYVMHITQLTRALSELASVYRVLAVNGVRLSHYQTLYFDSPDFDLYYQHHNGARPRYKVRSREYMDTQLSFLEVKAKRWRRTDKKRVRTDGFVMSLDDGAGRFVGHYAPVDVALLEPKLWNSFQRITLVSTRHAERLTLDINLQFEWGGRRAALPGIAIAEVKQEGVSTRSDFMQQMRAYGVRPTGFSKYCAGIGLLYDVKDNNFRPTMQRVFRLMAEGAQHDWHH